MTPETLATAMAIPLPRAQRWADPLTVAMQRFGVKATAMFLAQIGHESGSLVYVVEIWGPTEAQKRYEGRVDLGNTQPGDGRRYCGRGPMGITGRGNYTACGAALGINLVEFPQLLEVPENGALSAGWFWSTRNLDLYAEPGDDAAFLRLTRKINGGTNGLADRCERWQRAKRALAA